MTEFDNALGVQSWFDDICVEIQREESNLIARAFVMNISNLLDKNNITPIISKESCDVRGEITHGGNTYIVNKKLRYSLDSLDCSKHDKAVRAQAIDELANAFVEKVTEYEKKGVSEHSSTAIKIEILNIAQSLKEREIS